MPPVIQLTRRGAVRDDRGLPELRRTFAAQHGVKLPQLLEPGLVDQIQRQLAAAEFHEVSHGSLANEQKIDGGVAAGLLHFLVNDPALFQLIEDLSGCRGIGAFAGRVYRRCPGERHHLSWHTDATDARRTVGMSVNLSPAAFEGGVFELRDAGTEQPRLALPNVGVGDAILFRVSDALEHRGTEIVGQHPKVAFAGWFYRELDFKAVLHDRAL